MIEEYLAANGREQAAVFNYCAKKGLDVAEGMRIMYDEYNRLQYRKLPDENARYLAVLHVAEVYKVE